VDPITADFVVSVVLEERRRAAARHRMLRLAEAGQRQPPRRSARLGQALIAVGTWLEGNAAQTLPPAVAPSLAGSDGGRRG
jgi:hypothetical protein